MLFHIAGRTRITNEYLICNYVNMKQLRSRLNSNTFFIFHQLKEFRKTKTPFQIKIMIGHGGKLIHSIKRKLNSPEPLGKTHIFSQPTKMGIHVQLTKTKIRILIHQDLVDGQGRVHRLLSVLITREQVGL